MAPLWQSCGGVRFLFPFVLFPFAKHVEKVGISKIFRKLCDISLLLLKAFHISPTGSVVDIVVHRKESYLRKLISWNAKLSCADGSTSRTDFKTLPGIAKLQIVEEFSWGSSRLFLVNVVVSCHHLRVKRYCLGLRDDQATSSNLG